MRRPTETAAHTDDSPGAVGTGNFRPAGEAGQIALEYVLLLAAVVLPLVGVVYMLWEVLMYFYWNTALVVSIPYL